MSYNPTTIEQKWQKFWEENQTFKAITGSKKPKYYVLDMFPYPSSSGLHVGHPEGYTATDIVARYKRARGFNVLHPMGWDAFGLPAEQYALQTGVHPAITTQQAIDNFKRQLKSLGFSYDWSREIATCDPKYYKWTQYIFLKLFERGLAYQKEVPVNWCPALKTVLANEEVIDGKSERGNHPVHRVPMKQWMLKITAYAERLLKDLDQLDWPESTKELQRNWIGKSEGLHMKFPIAGSPNEIEIFTTRPDTIFGVTFMVLAPEHPLVNEISTPKYIEIVREYQRQAEQKSEISRQDTAQQKTGVFTGAFAINPANQERIPIWIADYVLMGYGTGAIMAVPAHDDRDAEFALKFDIPTRTVVQPINPSSDPDVTSCFCGEGISINSGFITGMPTATAKAAVINWAEENRIGKGMTQYKLRDWLFSRQRYWGEPFPILDLQGVGKRPLQANELPVVLPEVETYEPTGTGESPLAAITEWVNTVDPMTGKPARRETDTMPGSAGSSWYFLRYCDPHNEDAPVGLPAEKYWMPIDLYLGGPEHAVGHLLYARFWTKVLFDAGLVTHDEPFKKLVHQGMILGEDGEKMSKSRGNVINPDWVVEKYGADTLRIYEMFMGPLERDKPWSTSAIEGVYRFLQRVWRLFAPESQDELPGLKAGVREGRAGDLNPGPLSGGDPPRPEERGFPRLDESQKEPKSRPETLSTAEPTPEDLRMTHKTIKKVSEDIENLRLNTAISQMMIFVNHMTKAYGNAQQSAPRPCLKPFIQLLNPFAPHLAEELWEIIGEKSSLTYEAWPTYDPELAKDDLITIAVQVMGKTRGTLEIEPGTDQATIEEKAKEIAAVLNQLKDKQIRKVIFVKDKILNFLIQQ